MEKEIKKTTGISVENDDMHWTVECPDCEQEYNYTGWFDSSEITKCKCGTEFLTTKVYFDDDSYME